METAPSNVVRLSSKAPTGITGLDEITGGGLPRGRTTLLVGGSGSGKTILALQFLVHGAQRLDEPGNFVAFEEAPLSRGAAKDCSPRREPSALT